MHLDPNDPRLTAFALGELDEPERGEFEKHLADCAACRQEVEQLRGLAASLSQELASEPLPVEVRTIQVPTARPRRRTLRRLAVAASLLLIGGVGLMMSLPVVQNARRTHYDALETYDPESEVGALPEAMVPEFPGLEAPAKPDAASMLAADGVKRDETPRPPTDSDPTVGPSNEMIAKAILSRYSGQKDPASYGGAQQAPGTSMPGDGLPSARQRNDPQGPSRLAKRSGRSAPKPVAPTSPGVSGGMGGGMGQGMGGSNLDKLVGDPPITYPTAEVWDLLSQRRMRYRPLDIAPRSEREMNAEAYDRVVDNPFLSVKQNPLSTFSIDVDTASYSNVRRFLMEAGALPPPDAVRIEELVNYFAYDYAPPKDDAPFAANIEAADCPWNSEHRLVRIGIKGRVIADEDRPASNLVFLLDVSGSMEPANKLPLVRQAMAMLVRRLRDNDRVAIVVYQGAAGLVLPSTSGEEKSSILASLERLQAGGSTNGGEGIELAYKVAQENFIRGGSNRVILCTDGDFNVGVTNRGDLTRLIEKEAARGVFLTVLGFGMGNFKDATLEQLADRGNGNYGYVDTAAEARKLLVDQLAGTLVTIAKDVKIQVEFNPTQAAGYRLIGYENRLLQKEDFNNDKKDAGEIGAGHTVTALYEVIPAGQAVGTPTVDPLKYQPRLDQRTANPAQPAANASRELLTLKLRYKQPDGDKSTLIEHPFTDDGAKWSSSSRDFRFATAVAAFGMILRHSTYKGTATLASVQEWAVEGKGPDLQGYRGEFLRLLDRAKSLTK